jgi:hypothetical protein
MAKEETEELVPIYDETTETRKLVKTDKGARSLRKRMGEATLGLRYRMVKLIAPSAYRNWTKLSQIAMDQISQLPRPMIRFLKNLGQCNLVGVEIGVSRGENTLSILKELKVIKLFLVDPYMPFSEDRIPRNHGDYKESTIHRLANYPQVRWILKTSAEAAPEINESLDFIYIDGNHTYEYVKNDIELYYPKVKSHGVIGGHDYTNNSRGVIRALDEFVKTHGYIRDFFAVFPDWWLIKTPSHDMISAH